MSLPLLITAVLILGFLLFVAIARRIELQRMRATIVEREHAVRQGSAEAQLQHPVIDYSRCLGCATCVAACPEDGVLDLVHGQAMVVNGSRCVGIAACERECPVDAITVKLANLEERTDIPVLSEELEAVGVPGLFLAGEVTAHALIKVAVDQGTAVAADVAQRLKRERLVGMSGSTACGSAGCGSDCDELLDLCVVGAGPAGLACSLEAKRHGLSFTCIDQAASIGGTVAKYPRHKLVMTQPLELPLYGRMRGATFSKEEIIAVWEAVEREYELPIRYGETFVGVEREPDGTFVVRTETGVIRTRQVCMAIGRRGTPQALNVPGEDLSKVSNSLMDAHSYQGRKVLVVGGGDSAVEAAMALAEQDGNEVVLSYRKGSFFRLKARNEERLSECMAHGSVEVVFDSNVKTITQDSVTLDVAGESRVIANDDVFVMAGGIAPTELLSGAGVSFDPKLRATEEAVEEQGNGLVKSLAAAFALAILALSWVLWNAEYYLLPTDVRPTHPLHAQLRSGMGIGLWLGIASMVMIVINLLYVLRRSPRSRLRFGSLQAWMTSHVATGVLALLLALLHGAMAPGETPGGHAFWALLALMVTGGIGRYFYAYVPRAANGRELELAEVKVRLAYVDEEWDHVQRQFRQEAHADAKQLIEARQWGGSFFGRVLGLIGIQRDLRRVLARITERGLEQGVRLSQIRETVGLTRAAHRTALMVAHYEDLRAVLSTWRYLHRWIAALMLLILVVHVFQALAFGTYFIEGAVG